MRFSNLEDEIVRISVESNSRKDSIKRIKKELGIKISESSLYRLRRKFQEETGIEIYKGRNYS